MHFLRPNSSVTPATPPTRLSPRLHLFIHTPSSATAAAAVKGGNGGSPETSGPGPTAVTSRDSQLVLPANVLCSALYGNLPAGLGAPRLGGPDVDAEAPGRRGRSGER